MLADRTSASVKESIEKKIKQADMGKTAPFHLTVYLERNYLDGEVSEEVVKETVFTMDDFWAKYKQWQLAGMGEKGIFLQRKINDISPLLKANGYFGVSGNGILTIFYGRPDHSKVIQSFFQIDMKKLESTKQEELLQGIP
ncbi:MAG: BofC C-terminal domain-containing protein, partial [Bacillota bacterium]|nr:BofC C-terminal domain-containing protein [Bacillota bacterium]